MSFVFILIIVVIIILLITIVLVCLNSSRSPNHNAKCGNDSQCTQGLVCQSSTSTCVSPAGGTCTSNSQCISGSSCIQGVCIDSPSTGPVVNPLATPAPAVAVPAPLPVLPDSSLFSSPTPSLPAPSLFPSPQKNESTPILKRLQRGTGLKPLLDSCPSSSSFSDEEGGPGSDLDSHPGSDLDELEALDTPPYATRTDGAGKVCRHTQAISGRYVAASGQSVLDICSFSNMVLSLLESGWIVKGNTEKVANSVKLSRICPFDGYLYGLSADTGILHRLSPNSFSRSQWKWRVCDWSPQGLSEISTSLNGLYLCVQDVKRNLVYLYNGQLEQLKKISIGPGLIRSYGQDALTYVDVDPIKCEALVTRPAQEQRLIPDVCSVIFSNHESLVAIRSKDKSLYRAVRMVNWQPFYLGHS